jgi:SAM-dependent methyltransferase
MDCPLCQHSGKPFYRNVFFGCDHCYGIYRNRAYYISSEEEKKRYENHNNDVNDERYRQFVSPITNRVLQDFSPEHNGLDFGAGTGLVISKVLEGNGYNIVQYDPFFENHEHLLRFQYNYIVCCEVIEHFQNPNKEFTNLRSMLKPNGQLICMTHVYDGSTPFHDWYYKNDPTHVFIYQKPTIEYIARHFNLHLLKFEDRLIVWGV